MALSADDFQYLDGKFGETHKRISDVREDVARLEARACPDVKEHVGTYHRRTGDGNGNGNGRGSYPTVSGSMGMLKLWSLIVGVIVGTAGFLAVIQKLMGG